MRSPRVGGAAHRDRDRGRPEFGRVRDESGNILVLFAVLLPLFLFCCAIVIDVGYWWANGKRAQIAADSCALAAASKLPFSYPDDPECVITGTVASPTNPDYILTNLPLEGKANEPRWLNTVVTSPWAPEGAPNPADSYVRARVTIAVRTFFGRIIGKRVIQITRQAVAESAPGNMAIYARSRSCSDIGVRLNGENMDIDGGVWSNGAFTANGTNIDAESTDVGGENSCPPQTSSCPGCDLGNGTANPGIHNTYAEWPIWFEEGDFSCTVDSGNNDLEIKAGGPHVTGSTINSGVYCSDKEIKVETDNLTGTVTFLTPKLALKKGHDFRAFANNVVVFGTGTDEMVLNTDNSTFRGFLFHPGNSPSPTSDCPPGPQGRILLNGEFNTVIGMIAACEVHVNGKGFNMTGEGGQRLVALYE
jgi:Putative Flp pilus-assembly TadE/G-like